MDILFTSFVFLRSIVVLYRYLVSLSAKLTLKGVCHEIFNLHFFHDSNPSGPRINRLKYFLILFQFRRDILIFKKLRGVWHTAESDSAVRNTPWSQAPRSATHRGVK